MAKENITAEDLKAKGKVEAPKAEKSETSKKLVQLDIDNPKHANLTFEELQKMGEK